MATIGHLQKAKIKQMQINAHKQVISDYGKNKFLFKPNTRLSNK